MVMGTYEFYEDFTYMCMKLRHMALKLPSFGNNIILISNDIISVWS